jgi:uncharacterized YccA/Bax inhibitor family protein
MAFTTSSPMMRPELFEGRGSFARAQERSDTMTVSGTINATAILLALCVASATGSWMLIAQNAGLVLPVMLGGFGVGLVAAIVMFFKPSASVVLGPLYALGEGAMLGGLSLFYAEMSRGTKLGGATGANIVVTAAIATFAILGVMLGLYKLGFIRADGKFKAVMLVCGAAIGVYALVVLGMMMFGSAPAFLFSGPIAIGITSIILVYASFCLILDFDFIEQGAASGAPKYMEWYGGVALLATLVWIYLKVLRLLSLLNRRN